MTRVRLLDVAEDLFRVRGYHGVSVSEVTAALGMTKPNLYNHFRDKAEMYIAVRQRHLRRVEADLQRALSLPGPFGERLFAAVAVLLRRPFFLDAVRLREEEDFLDEDARNHLFALAYGGIYQPLIDLLRSGVASGDLAADEAALPFAHDALIALVQGLAPPPERLPDTAERVVSLLLAGIGAPGRQARAEARP